MKLGFSVFIWSSDWFWSLDSCLSMSTKVSIAPLLSPFSTTSTTCLLDHFSRCHRSSTIFSHILNCQEAWRACSIIIIVILIVILTITTSLMIKIIIVKRCAVTTDGRRGGALGRCGQIGGKIYQICFLSATLYFVLATCRPVWVFCAAGSNEYNDRRWRRRIARLGPCGAQGLMCRCSEALHNNQIKSVLEE